MGGIITLWLHVVKVPGRNAILCLFEGFFPPWELVLPNVGVENSIVHVVEAL